MDVIFTLNTIQEIATAFWKYRGDANVIAFHGEMGAGKTTFIHALCDAKGVVDVVGSPTFSIINEYVWQSEGLSGKIFHIDLYRLKNEQEAVQAGVEECFYSDHVSFVEWPERAPGIFPPDTLHVYISLADSGARRLRIGRN